MQHSRAVKCRQRDDRQREFLILCAPSDNFKNVRQKMIRGLVHHNTIHTFENKSDTFDVSQGVAAFIIFKTISCLLSESDCCGSS
jgi:hypothetical protein